MLIANLPMILAPFFVGGVLILLSVIRTRKRFSQSADAKWTTIVNELGGALILGVFLLLIGIGMVVSWIRKSPPSEQPQKPQQHTQVKIETNAQQRSALAKSIPPHNEKSAKGQPEEIVRRYIGHWELLGEQDGEKKLVAHVIASKVDQVPWVVWQVSDLEGVLRAIQVTGFHEEKSQYNHHGFMIGATSTHFVGTWDDKENSFTWVSESLDDKKEVIRESIEDAVIRSVHETIVNGVIQRTSAIELRRIKPPLAYHWGSPVFKQYAGHHSLVTETSLQGGEPITNAGRAIFRPLSNPSILVGLYFNAQADRLADVQLIQFDRGDEPLRRRWITPDGQPIELLGSVDREPGQIEWKGRFTDGSALTLTDIFSRGEIATTTMRRMSKTGAIQGFSKTIWKRMEK